MMRKVIRSKVVAAAAVQDMSEADDRLSEHGTAQNRLTSYSEFTADLFEVFVTGTRQHNTA